MWSPHVLTRTGRTGSKPSGLNTNPAGSPRHRGLLSRIRPWFPASSQPVRSRKTRKPIRGFGRDTARGHMRGQSQSQGGRALRDSHRDQPQHKERGRGGDGPCIKRGSLRLPGTTLCCVPRAPGHPRLQSHACHTCTGVVKPLSCPRRRLRVKFGQEVTPGAVLDEGHSPAAGSGTDWGSKDRLLCARVVSGRSSLWPHVHDQAFSW